MIKNGLKIKDNITIIDIGNAVKKLVNSYFIDGGYTPYYSSLVQYQVIVENFITGYELEEDDDVVDIAMNDPDMWKLVLRFFYDVADTDEAGKANDENLDYINIMNGVLNNVKDVVEFEKQKQIHSTDEIMDTLYTIKFFMNDVMDSIHNFANLSLSKMSSEDIDTVMNFMKQIEGKDLSSETIGDALKQAVDFKVPETEIYEGQRQHIAEQRKIIEDLRGQLKDKENTDNITEK